MTIPGPRAPGLDVARVKNVFYSDRLGKVKHTINLSTRAISVLSLALLCSSLPLYAQTPPILKIADSSGNSIIIDSTGVPTGTGSFSTSSVSASAGFIDWSGTVGNFVLLNIRGESKPVITPPALDVEIGSAVNNGPGSGTVTISFTDTNFTASGPESLNVLGTGATFSSYIDTSNAPFGMNTPVGSISNPTQPVTTETFNVSPSRTTRVSLTVVVTIPLASGGQFIDDFAVFAATPPLALACPASTGQVGVPYSSALVATGGVPDYTYSIQSGVLPPGLSLTPTTGAITGTPTTVGSFPFVAQVIDQSGGTANTATASCGINIGPPGLSLFCAPATTGKVGVPFNSSLSAIGGVTPYAFSLSSGSLPPGLTLSPATGAITGTPTTQGSYPFVAQVSDAMGSRTTASCGIAIAPPGLSVLCPTVSTGAVGVPYSSALVAAGGISPYTFSISSGSLPPGLTLNTTTGAITGTPTSAASFPFTAKVTDSEIPAVSAFSSSCGISIGSALTTCVTRYAANLAVGESYIDITNTGANGAPLQGPGFGAALGNICANVYTFDASEELVSCCSCLITPDQTVNLGVNRDLVSLTVTGVVPTSVTVKICATLTGLFGEDTNCGNSAASVNGDALVGGITAWSTTLHATPKSGVYATTAAPFTSVTPSVGDLASMSGRCASIIGNASGFGICGSCRAGALGGQKL